jgi:glycosyltransferase involved in cell wall biosynthesis
MKLSLIVPTYTINKELEMLASMCLSSFFDQVDEIIVSEDGGFYSPEIERLCNVYIYSHDNVGFTKNVNRAWKLATGDYFAIVNSDVTYLSGNIKDLCVPGKVTSPETRGQPTPKMAGHFFVVPKEIKEKYGTLDESMKMFCSDADYEKRIGEIFQKVSSVEILHGLNKTINAAGITNGTQLTEDREILQLKQRGIG